MRQADETQFLITLGFRVREIRKQKGLTQEDLGFSIGNSGKQIGRVERGENNVTTLMIYRIAKALEVPIHVFFDRESED